MALPGRIWLVGDTHFYHHSITNFCNREPNWKDKIIKQWKHYIKEKDIIIHLGDVLFGNKEQLTDILSILPGTKILIKGNHDKYSDIFYIEAGFSAVFHSATYYITVFTRKSYVVLSHKPTRISLEENWYNIHGHFHNAPQKNWEPELKNILTNRHYLYILEKLKYKPILLKDAIEKGILSQTLECGLEENSIK